jgi:hypothetical protein
MQQLTLPTIRVLMSKVAPFPRKRNCYANFFRSLVHSSLTAALSSKLRCLMRILDRSASLLSSWSGDAAWRDECLVINMVGVQQAKYRISGKLLSAYLPNSVPAPYLYLLSLIPYPYPLSVSYSVSSLWRWRSRLGTIFGNGEQLLKAWKEKTRPLQGLWYTWSTQYILSLRKRNQGRLTGTSSAGPAIQEGDEVISKPKTERTTRMAGKIRRLICRSDGAVRSEEIMYSSRWKAVVPVR